MILVENLKKTFELTRYYWRIYGGYKAVLYSPYFIGSVMFTVISCFYWSDSSAWAQDVIDVIPSILGFSLGGFAIFMAFSDKKFIDLLVDKNEDESFYLQLNIQFIHFIVVQTLSILFALLNKGWLPPPDSTLSFPDKMLSMIGYLLFSYAMFTAIALAFSLLRFGRLYHTYRSKNDNE